MLKSDKKLKKAIKNLHTDGLFITVKPMPHGDLEILLKSKNYITKFFANDLGLDLVYQKNQSKTDELGLNLQIMSIDEIADICKKSFARFDLKKVYIYGSYARSEAKLESDINLLIDYKRNSGFSMFELVELQAELKELLGRRVTALTVGGLKGELKRQALREAKIVYGE